MKALREAIGGAAFHAAKTGNRAKCLRVKPVLGTLRAEMLHEQFDFLIEDICAQRDIAVGLSEVSIPLGNFIFQHKLIAKHVPGQFLNGPMILMGIPAAMREDEVRCEAVAQGHQPGFDLPGVSWEIAVLKMSLLNKTAMCSTGKATRSSQCFCLSNFITRQNTPFNIQRHSGCNQAQDSAATADFNIV